MPTTEAALDPPTTGGRPSAGGRPTSTAWWRWLPWSVTVLLLAVGSALPPLPSDQSGGGWGAFVLLAAQALTFATVGRVLVGVQAGNAVSWLFSGVGLLVAFYLALGRYSWLALDPSAGLPAGEATTWVQTWLYVPALGVVITVLPLLFPTGRLVSRRWWPALALALVATLGILLSDALAPGSMDETGVPNPVAMAPGPYAWLTTVGGLLFVAAALTGFVSLVARWRTSSYAERQQLKWFAYFALMMPVFAIANAVINLFGLGGHYRTVVVTVIAVGAFLGLPIGVAISILRYRLYDIDLVIKRTVVYAALTAALVAAYLVAVLLLRLALSPVTGRSDLAVAGSTLAVAALFRPLRGRIQRGFDRRFFRPRYDAQHTVERFAGGLRGELDVASMSEALRHVVHRTMQPTHVTLWLTDPPDRR